MHKNWTFRRPWADWYSGGRRDILVPIGGLDQQSATVQVPQRFASYTALPPTTRIIRLDPVANMRWRARRYRDSRRTVFRYDSLTRQRPVIVPLEPGAQDVVIFSPIGVASYTAYAPQIVIKDVGDVVVPLAQATYTAFAPEIPPQIVVDLGVATYTALDPTVNADPSKPAGKPYLIKRRRRFVLPNGQFFEGTDAEAIERLRQFLADQAKKDQLTRPKDERPKVPAMTRSEDAETLELPEVGTSMLSLPDLRVMQFQLQAQQPQSIDPQLLSVLLQRIDDEEAAMLLL